MKLPGPGILVAVEGVDGAGKTTLVGALMEHLARLGLAAQRTKEPTDRTEAGRRIRASAASVRLPLADELHAFLEDRRSHVESLIAPALERGEVVVVDRYYLSSIAYQGARGASPAKVRELNEAFAPIPDLVLVLDIDVDIGLARVRARGEVSSFEQRHELLAAKSIFDTLQGPGVLHLDALAAPAKVAEVALGALLDGPLRQRLCGASGELCEPAYCVRREDCGWPVLLNRADLAPDFRAAALAILGDESIPELERVARLAVVAGRQG